MPQNNTGPLKNVPEPLHDRLSQYSGTIPDWRTHYAIGTVLSDIAQSFWCVQPKGWYAHYNNLLRIALDRFRLARGLLDGSNERLRVQIVRCEEIIAQARLAREQYTNDPPTTAAFIPVFESLHRLHGDTPKHCPDAWHQTAIAYSLSAQIAWGQRLGYMGWADEEYATSVYNGAIEMFTKEAAQTPDKERAYRSLLINMALAYDSLQRGRSRKHYAALAMRSARRYGDSSSYRRALAVYLAGQKGEVLWRRLHDGRTLNAFK